jgi:hypothetical protein
MTAFWTGFVVGFSYFGVIVGAGRLCGLADAQREREQ